MLKIQKELQKIDARYNDPGHYLFLLEKAGVIEPGLIAQVQHPEHPELFLFNYRTITDFSNPLVQECRGLILDSTDNRWNPVCWGFKKFFNAHEAVAAPIDWNTASVYEKLDGTLCYLWWHNGKWNMSTNGSPGATGNVGTSDKTFNELFWEVFNDNDCVGLGHDLPHVFSEGFKDITFLFELMTPENQIVVRHQNRKLVLIGARNRVTGEEIPTWAFKNCWPVVKQYDFSNLESATASLENVSAFDQEGYVVVDKNWNRIKIKSPQYVRMHHLRSDFSQRKCVEIILNGEADEFISYFPEFTKEFIEYQIKIDTLTKNVLDKFDEIKHHTNQKDFALEAIKYNYNGILFALKKGDIVNVNEYLKKLHIKRTIELLEHY